MMRGFTSIVVLCLIVLESVALAAEPIQVFEAHVEIKEKVVQREIPLKVVRGPCLTNDAKNCIASARFEDGLLQQGWGILNIETNPETNDEDQAYAAGLLEGFLTAEHIFTTGHNLAQELFGEFKMPDDVLQFMREQEGWLRASAKSRGFMDPVLRHAGFIIRQYDGLLDGYILRQPEVPALEDWVFMMINGVGDLFDIRPAVNKSMRVNWTELPRREAEMLHSKSGHCSAFIKLTPDFSDLLFGHSSWFLFANTNRIFKHYNLRFNDKHTAAHRVSFSSYPAMLESLDDFYMLSSGIAWIQTTNPVLNNEVYDTVRSNTLLTWQRVRIASAMATSGPHWFEVFQQHASGTYANQYMIIDFNMFEPFKPLPNNTLFLVEEMPGLVVGSDQTQFLRRGYWSSYNIPFNEAILARSGYSKMAAAKGDFFTNDLNPRAKIFRREEGKVADLDGLKKILRHNDFLHDPFSLDGSKKNPFFAICSRGDLLNNGKVPNGCYDTKVTSFNHGVKKLRADILNGPTKGLNDQFPPFTWSEFPEHTHKGLPDVYDFPFITTEPTKSLIPKNQQSSD